MNFKETWKNLKNKVTKSELELKLKLSVSDDPRLNYLTLIEEIASKTEDKNELEIIMKFIKKKLNSKKWQRILKTLKLIAFLLKCASKDFVAAIIYEKQRIEVLTNYYCHSNGSSDIREKSKQIMSYLKNEKLLKEERDSFLKTKKLSVENEKKNTGGLLNSIGSYNNSQSLQGTFGLSKGNSILNSNNVDGQKGDDSDSDSDEKNSSPPSLVKRSNITGSSNITEFNQIFENNTINKNDAAVNNPFNQINLLCMSDLFTDSNPNSNFDKNNFTLNNNQNINLNNNLDFTFKDNNDEISKNDFNFTFKEAVGEDSKNNFNLMNFKENNSTPKLDPSKDNQIPNYDFTLMNKNKNNNLDFNFTFNENQFNNVDVSKKNNDNFINFDFTKK